MNLLYLTPDPETAHWHNHVKKLTALAAAGKLTAAPGTVLDVEVLHDDGCALLAYNGFCDCDPDIRVRELT